MASDLLVTGGMGFIGSHTTVALQEAGFRVTIVDNLSNSSLSVLDGISGITGVAPEFYEGDVRDAEFMSHIFDRRKYSAVLHFAGLKAVGESTSSPLDYYDNNVNGTLVLLKAMQTAGVKTFIFSSSATVYGHSTKLPLSEDQARSATNPYGHTKLVVEDILENLYKSEDGWAVARLRYFNPVGAHPSGRIGESPNGVPNNLMPYVAQVAAGVRTHLSVFGDDYDTHDGTGVRDYIHVVDLAEGHVKALEYCLLRDKCFLTLNLGTGRGYSVLDLVKTFKEATGVAVPYQIVERRAGDVDSCWADTSLAAKTLGWVAKKGLKEMCEDTWRWQCGMGK